MNVITGDYLKEARRILGWSTFKLGFALRLAGDRHRQGQRIRTYEEFGKKAIGGPMGVLVEAFLIGYRPPHLVEAEYEDHLC